MDVRYALRTMRRSPVFTLVAVLALALGIGANTAIFSFIDAILLKSLPVSEPARLSIVRYSRSAFGNIGSFGYPFFRELERHNDVFSGMAAWRPIELNLTAGDETERVRGELVSGGYFEVLGIRSALGRLLEPDDDGIEGAHPVCVISHDLWQRRFGSDPDVLRTSVALNTHTFQIVGVTASGFHGAELHGRYDIQVPMSMTRAFMNMERDSWGWTWLQIVARRKPGVSHQQAEASLDRLARSVDAGNPKNGRTNGTYALIDGRQGFSSLQTRLSA